MPELPEVETTRRGIAPLVVGQSVLAMDIRERQFRWPISDVLPEIILGKTLKSVDRRGKYLLWRFEHGTMLIHLGMSGSMRALKRKSALKRHDHVEWVFDNRIRVRLHDPRRFGAVLWHPASDGPVEDHPLLVRLGVEPMAPAFNADHLLAGIKGRRISIKQALLQGNVVVGVGNIYCSESLFRAGIHPETPAGALSPHQAERLVNAVRIMLGQALRSGGSTLRDYVSADAKPGSYFKTYRTVYRREGHPCPTCDTPIQRIVQAKRATYFCPSCQPNDEG